MYPLSCGRPESELRVAGVEALSLQSIGVYGKQATGEKYLINPNKDS